MVKSTTHHPHTIHNTPSTPHPHPINPPSTHHPHTIHSPAVFRDLRLPMGIQNRAQREARSELYHELASTWNPDDDMSELPFHYGSMYSNPAFVLWYLLRLEPYASLHIHLNDGRFDKPDRLFDSMAKTYEGWVHLGFRNFSIRQIWLETS